MTQVAVDVKELRALIRKLKTVEARARRVDELLAGASIPRDPKDQTRAQRNDELMTRCAIVEPYIYRVMNGPPAGRAAFFHYLARAAGKEPWNP
jgi:hypothetical protein